jgi:hypothetical protein
MPLYLRCSNVTVCVDGPVALAITPSKHKLSVGKIADSPSVLRAQIEQYAIISSVFQSPWPVASPEIEYFILSTPDPVLGLAPGPSMVMSIEHFVVSLWSNNKIRLCSDLTGDEAQPPSTSDVGDVFSTK